MTDDELSLRERSLREELKLIEFEIKRRRGWQEHEKAQSEAYSQQHSDSL